MENENRKWGIGKLLLVILLIVLAGFAGYMFKDKTKEMASAKSEQQSNHAEQKKTDIKKDDMDMSDMKMEDEGKKESKEKKILYWVDPMHPVYKSDKPGIAPDCGMQLVPVYAEEEGTGEAPPKGSTMITSTKQQIIGVTYGVVSVEPLTRTIRTVGRITYDETKIVKINPKIEGWIEKVYVDFTGKLVKKGQPLISIYSPELVSTQQEYLLALKSKEYLSKSPFPEIANSSNSLLQSTKKRLEFWDIREDEIREIEKRGEPVKTMTLYAPSSGFVLTRNAFERQRVMPESELYTIADLSRVWVLADIYEYEIPMIKLGQTATIMLSYYPGEIFSGKVTYIYPQLDNITRTLKVRLEFSNPDFKLKPDMYANVGFQINYGKQISVPEEAVLDSGNEQIVFVAREEGLFEPRKVSLGAKVDKRFIILEGLKDGEKIVTSGNFLIDSESRLKSAMGGMEGMGHGGGEQAGEVATGEEQKIPSAPVGKQKQEQTKMPPMPGM
ncbi:MAG: hypothetical protein A3C43_00620 [Candidatus Schekmanbacteria bacterium RIFCSPHIGHO2_02_FULL_38_11]|uniref:Uncharacterized protein n=1 Tax=Candidatus Schekmanbacteria bacterium RIFCSPLOWO2_12_FULL_38_15 TaxID=1817883 RepID=A0A1F7SND1_9BACT|nr:MAG: hypothetical protein A3H37_05455 [Candidatus Schekmanbacteria bacterium RIFCSPLOWO2_02_FULL_38_14]OGL52011.1 MAG: hypothetical protein A3C43_00620 [Candidatus Schekmanbacteria bacterium RIFCSPHIGHO2_02_FULL_38_11]OGL55300.1 MAG: hypothetical protein A3G31_04655 [Candidatus Schekmanbacteria bacterium RIFCSPLOWO2_12_FULL_38_15]